MNAIRETCPLCGEWHQGTACHQQVGFPTSKGECMNRMRVRCVVCGKETAARCCSNRGRSDTDGSERYPRRHDVNGKPCPGNIEYAEWLDKKEKV
jgi:hypothetical protein